MSAVVCLVLVFSRVSMLQLWMAEIPTLTIIFTLQEAALKLGVLTHEEFDTLVVPEKMLGPSD